MTHSSPTQPSPHASGRGADLVDTQTDALSPGGASTPMTPPVADHPRPAYVRMGSGIWQLLNSRFALLVVVLAVFSAAMETVTSILEEQSADRSRLIDAADAQAMATIEVMRVAQGIAEAQQAMGQYYFSLGITQGLFVMPEDDEDEAASGMNILEGFDEGDPRAPSDGTEDP